jgi:F-type H+-transporting ATPase subunit a
MSFGSEAIFHIGAFPLTNTFLDILLVDGLIIAAIVAIKVQLSKVPGLFQNIMEFVLEAFHELTESVAGSRTTKIFPYFATFFFFILLINWSGLIPGFGTIGFREGKNFIPLFRSATSDLNTTLALALVSAVATHMLSIQTLGVKEYLGRYFSLNPINLFIGLLELIGEITKVISLSFRLFGNVFAGEVVLSTVSGIFAFLFPLPFLALEVIVGLVQALVFSMLTMSFMAILTTPHSEGGEHS